MTSASIRPFPAKTQDVWPFTVNATVAAGLLVAFHIIGVLVGFFGVKGGLL